MTLRTYRRMNQQSAKAKAVEALLDEARPRVFKRDGYRCQANLAPDCSGRCEDLHHVLPRSRGGTHDDDNLLGVCRSCHLFIDSHPAIAVEAGVLQRGYGR